MSTLNNTHIQAGQAVNNIEIEDVYPEFEQWIDFEIDDVDIVRDPNLSDHSHEYQIQSDSGQLQQVSSSHNERAQVDQVCNISTDADANGQASSSAWIGLLSRSAVPDSDLEPFPGPSAAQPSNDSATLTVPFTFHFPAHSTPSPLEGMISPVIPQDDPECNLQTLLSLWTHTSESNTLSASKIAHGDHFIPLCNGVSSTFASQPTQLPLAGAAPMELIFDPPLETTRAVGQEQEINVICRGAQARSMSSQIPAAVVLSNRQSGHTYHQPRSPSPLLLSARADTVSRLSISTLASSPSLPEPVLVSSPFPSSAISTSLYLSPQSTPHLSPQSTHHSPQPTPPQLYPRRTLPIGQSTAPPDTTSLSPSTPRRFFILDPEMPSKPKIDGRRHNALKILKREKAQEERRVWNYNVVAKQA